MKARGTARSGGILVVDDDLRLATTLQTLLNQEGYSVAVAVSAAEALAWQERNPDLAVALVDLIMPVTDGLQLMDELHRRDPDLAVVLMTGYGTIETAVEAIKRGAEDYLTKPIDSQAVRKKVARLMEVFELRERVSQLEANLQRYPSFESMICVSSPMERVLERARAAAATDVSLLLLGETGTGKELLARAIHASSGRAPGPFVPVNCGAIPCELVESELFGYRRGAFTGAHADTPGIFATAAGGTVFLDEIGEMPREAQVKLLRVLQEGELRPVGSSKSRRIDVRVIAASNRPLPALKGEFLREDLYYRVATLTIELPPLRTRPEDVLVLAQHFLTRFSKRAGREITLSRSAADLLVNYAFPGNVRELEHLLEGAMTLCREDQETLTEKDFKSLLSPDAVSSHATDYASQPLSLEVLERLAIQQALRQCEGNRTRAASMLGISRDTLHRKLRQYRDGD